MSTKALRESRAVHGRKIRDLSARINKENRDFTAAERTEWDAANSQFDALTRSIGVGNEEGRRGSGAPGMEDRTGGDWGERESRVDPALQAEAEALALQGWARRAVGKPLRERHVNACRALGKNLNPRGFTVNLPRQPGVEQRSLSAVTGTSGGYTVPQGFVPVLEKALKTFAQLRMVADVMRTDAGNAMPFPTADDTGNVGERIAENTTVANADPTFGVVTFGAYKYSSKLVLVPAELLEDSAFIFTDWLGKCLGERLGRANAVDFTTGTGSSQPQGVVTGATLGKTAALATAITADEIIDLIHSVDPAYRISPSFGLMMSDGVLQAIRKLKDGQGRYLFQDTLTGDTANGWVGTVFGVKVFVNPQMQATIATGTKTILAGDFSKYKIRDVNKIRFRQLVERYAELDQVGFLALMRTDAKLMDAATHPIKYLIQA